MESKPIVTCAGDEKLFSSLKTGVIEGLPEESVEWRRSHVRNPKTVYVTANFISFSEDCLPKDNEKNLLGQAFFHIYWTECNDIDTYKQSVKDGISSWLSKLKSRKIYDWLIVVVDHIDSKKVNKTKLLPRTTVLDKIKSDFPSQGSQRCISLLDPCRNDARAVESWQSLLQRIRQLILQAYSRQLSQFEEFMRTQRERRNEPGWNFQDFFFLQEELAFVLEMLGLYDEALVQYDELDALFTQFVINSNVGDMPEWLSNYSKSCDVWSGVCLMREKSIHLREILQKAEACLLDLRNYLFSRQCALLLLLCRPWEVAQRTLPFLHNCISELQILEISMPPGSVACWVFLSCLEVLETCEKFSDTSQIKSYSLYTAGLWAYAREKLHELGLLCGLMPDLEATSEQLHLVVGLLSGMGEDPYPETGQLSPHSRLREALSSKDSFLKHYLELSELTMGTFKHNRRIRTARYIGRDLAQFYMKLQQPQKAASFLSDLYKTYKEENWERLAVVTQQDMFECYCAMNDTPKYLKTCIRLSASPLLSLEQRESYFQEILKWSEKLGTDSLLLRTEKTFIVSHAVVESSEQPMISRSDIKITFDIQSNLPSEIICRFIKVTLKHENSRSSDKSKQSGTQAHLSPKRSGDTPALSPLSPMQSGVMGIPSHEDMPPRVMVQPQLVTHCYYQQDGSLTCGILCKNQHQVLKRRDSQGFQKEREIAEEESGLHFKANNVKLVPGQNVISVTVKITEPGLYSFNRMWMEWGNIQFILTHLSSPLSFTVVEELPTVSLKPIHGDLVAGIEQQLMLSVSSGSNCIENGAIINLKPSRGLKFKGFSNNNEWLEVIEIPLPSVKPFQTVSLPLNVIAHFGPQKNANTVEHRVTLQCEWASSPYYISLHFLPPFLTAHKLHTCGTRKYVQVVVHGLTKKQFAFQNTELESTDEGAVILKSLNNYGQILDVSSEQSACFLWEIMTEDVETLPLKFLFTASYQLKEEINNPLQQYQLYFRLENYKTLYTVRARVEPPKGSEFCRAGIVCNMHITINQSSSTVFTSLMYEVVADQAMWAVCGRTAGVVNIDSGGKHSVTIDVMPLIGGFLPLPTVRLSKYIPAEPAKPQDVSQGKDGGSYQNVARLEPFDPGQVYSWSRATQVHVLPAPSVSSLEAVS